jgi:metallo-beta-lactamase class B
MTLVAHLTAGHTRGCTTWTTKAQEDGKMFDVVFNCSLRAPAVLTPAIVDELNRSFRLVRSLPCDVTLGDHPAQYKMQEKFGKLKNTGSNPFIDPAGCLLEADIQESMLRFLTSSAKRLVLSSRINKRQLPTQPQDRGS